MNKLIIFPLVVMIICSFFGIFIELTENPVVIEEPSATGYFTILENGEVIWNYNNTNIGYCTSDGGYSPYDPRDAPDLEFRLHDVNPFEGWVGYYDNLDNFYDEWNTTATDTPEINDIFDTKLLWGGIILVLGATVALGIKVFGTGLSEFAQRTAYLGIVWGTFWVFLSITSGDLLIAGVLGFFGTALFTMLTLGYIVGVIIEVTSGGD